MDTASLLALSAFGRTTPLSPRSKTPKFKRERSSKDPLAAERWRDQYPGCNLGVWIDSTSDVFVLDLDCKGHSQSNGLDTIEQLELHHGSLPRCPSAITVGGGLHMYFRVPQEFCGRLKSWGGPLPGVDVRTRNSLIVVPPSADYRWLVSLAECEIPFAPLWLMRRLLEKFDGPRFQERSAGRTSSALLDNGRTPRRHCSVCSPEPVPPKLRALLFRNDRFREVWNRTKEMPCDNTNSAFEFSLAEHAFARGATAGQVITLVHAWDLKHGAEFKDERLRRDILPSALRATENYRKAYERKQRNQKLERQRNKTKNRVLVLLAKCGPLTPADVESRLGISRSAATMQLWRLARSGGVTSARGVYQIPQEQQSTGALGASSPRPESLDSFDGFRASLNSLARSKNRRVLQTSFDLLQLFATTAQLTVSAFTVAGWCNAAVEAEDGMYGRKAGAWVTSFLRLGITTIQSLSHRGYDALLFHGQLNAYYGRTGGGGVRLQVSLRAFIELAGHVATDPIAIRAVLDRLLAGGRPRDLAIIVDAIRWASRPKDGGRFKA